MAFLRYARSNVVKPKIYANEWDKIRVASSNKRMDYSLKEQAERVLGEPFSPDKYLLTHSTIVCSVDAVNGYDTKLGEVTYDGEKINRRYTDYKVTTETDQFINNNMDCWSRGVIEKSYKSFIGSHNFVEHIQVEELSKGKIIDAVLRDVGESLYVDILVATNKKHTELVEQILSGQMNAMSMGCFIAGSQVSLSNGKRIAIEEIQPGEKVITHQGNTKEVLNKQMRKGKWNMRTIKVQGISSPITATDNHPFFVVDLDGSYKEVRADDLSLSSTLFCPLSDGQIEKFNIESIANYDYEGWVYDLEVEDDHSYIVNGVSVHNCSVDFTVCTKCGNVAADETEMCKHIKYEKGNVFYDEKGQPHRVAELCGHETENPNGGVTFIEASWVATPAFKGAVARNVLEVPTPFTDKLAKEEVISKKAHQVYALTKTNNKLAGPFDDMDFGGGGGDAGGGDAGGGEGGAAAPAAPPPPSPFDDLQKELQTYLVDKIKNKLMEEFEFKLDKKKKDSELDMTKSSVHENDTIIREANTKTANHKKVSKVVKEYNNALNMAIKVAKSNSDVIKNISYVNDKYGIKISSHLYKLATKLGSANQYGSLDTFLIVANEYSDRPLKQNEKMILVRLAKLLSTKNK
jgi:hypothetical protein